MTSTQSVTIVKDQELEILIIENNAAKASISLFGAHVLSFVPKHDNRERIWLSPCAIKDGKKPIRGGVPVCWPWFSDLHGLEKGALPSHGYVRDQSWIISDCQEAADQTVVTLSPVFTEHNGFSGKPSLSFQITVGKSLSMSLTTKNIGEEAFTYTCALHTYFQINDINQIYLEGLSGQYKDKTRNFDTFDTPEHYTIAGETDRVHLCDPVDVLIKEEKQVTTVSSEGHDSIVVWNPGQENAKNMADMEDSGYLTMVCVETAVTEGLTVEPGESHTLAQTIK